MPVSPFSTGCHLKITSPPYWAKLFLKKTTKIKFGGAPPKPLVVHRQNV
jgi:hypothetical protein